ncbi:MAG: hypothetical protein WDO74_29270 [Pseudomonadota bacterium]
MSAMYYLNRGGAPEGPFEEARLVHMIQTGELSQGGVCPVGHHQWLALEAVPAFARALAGRPAPTVYGPPTAYDPPPTAQGAPPGAAPAHGYPRQPAYGQQAGYEQQAGHRQPPAAANRPQSPPGKRIGVLIAAFLGVLLLLAAASGTVAYFAFLRSGGARAIAQSVPRDSEFFIEVASVHQLVAELHDVQYLDTSLRDDKKVFDDAADSIAKAFDLSQTDAVTLLASAETFGVAGRKLASSPELLLALGLKNARPVETLLKSSRFIAAGTLGQTGKRYQLTRKALDASVEQDVVRKELARAQIGAGAKEALVWFPKARVLAIGDEPLLLDMAQVLESGAASIEQNPSFQAAAKDFDKSSRLTAFVDPTLFASIADPKVKELVDAYFKPAGPITGTLLVKPAGFVTSFTGHVQGSKLPHAGEPPRALNLGERLPEETFGYVALSTSTKLTGAETEKLLIDQLSSVDPQARVQLEQGLRQLEQLLGVSASKLIDGAAGQSVIGLSAPAGTSIAALGTGPQALAHFNLTWVLELKDATEYKKLATQLKQKILPTVREVTVTDDGPGFSLGSRLPLPISLRVKFFDKYLFLTAGGNTLCERAEAAFSKGERTLRDDAAHKSSLAALPDKQHFLLWVDSGRLADALQKNPLLRAQMTESGLSLDKIRLTGPERIVSALSVSGEVANEVWTFQLDALNFHGLAPLGAGGALLAGGLRLPGL